MVRSVPRGAARAVASPRAPSGSEPGGALWDELGTCHRMLRAELRDVVRAEGMYLAEYRALRRLQEGEFRFAELADHLGQSPASLTDLARQLESHGWALRRQDPRDRRAYLLSCTPRGSRAFRGARSEYRRRLAEVYRLLDPRTRLGLSRSLWQLRAILERRRSLPMENTVR